MKSIDDPQLRFYLERKDLIDRWAALRSLESGAVDRVLTSLAPAVDALAVELGGATWIDRTSTQGVLGIYRPEWQVADERPAVFVAIGWNPSRTSFTEPERSPWIGPRLRRGAPYDELTTRVGHALHRRRAATDLPSSDGPTANWPAYRWCPKPGDVSWDDLEPYRMLLLHSLRDAWRATIDIIDSGLDEAEPHHLPEVTTD